MAAAIAFAVPLGCGESESDPASARCDAPNPHFGDVHILGDHKEIGSAVRPTFPKVPLRFRPLCGSPGMGPRSG